jgi:CRISPR/Cas system-associated endoribonuclease Cas2
MIYDVNVDRVTKCSDRTQVPQPYPELRPRRRTQPRPVQKLKHEVTQIINPEHDSVRFYLLRTTQYMTVDKLGVPSRPGDAQDFL